MQETALVFSVKGESLYWHEPEGRSAGFLPDSRTLWEVLWEARQKGGSGLLGGVAHTHPWNGPAHPSGTDLSTFRAIELGLGQQLWWVVATFTDVRWYRWSGDSYIEFNQPFEIAIAELLTRSQ